MSESNYIERHEVIKRMLADNILFKAINLMIEYASEGKLPSIASRLLAINSSYSMLSEYAIKGLPDPSREIMHSNIRTQLEQLNDLLLKESLVQTSSESYYEAARFARSGGKSLQDMVNCYLDYEVQSSLAMAANSDDNSPLRHKEDTLFKIFRMVWTLQPDSDNLSLIKDIALSDRYPLELKSQVLTAVLLNLLKFYNSELLITLIDIYEQSSLPTIQAWAMIDIILTLSLHNRTTASDLALKSRLQMWDDNILVYTQLREVVRNIIKTRDTDRVTTKMQEEIFPEIMKLSPEIIKKMRDESTFSDVTDFENNPEWEELLDKNGVGDKLRELSEMQADGSDVMMPAFSNLKNFSFFNQINNWFLPFSPDHSSFFGKRNELSSVYDMMSIDSGLCDSDRYSLLLSISSMPDAQRNMFTSQLDAQISQMAEIVKDASFKNPEFNREVSRHLKDLYRFFRLYRKKDDFKDPFKDTFDFLSLTVVGDTLNDPDTLRLISEFYFSHSLYEDALPLFRALETTDGTESALWEKEGFCLQQLHDYEGALKAYLHAELLREPGEWLLKKLAFVNKKLGNYEDASGYYSKLLESNSDNVGWLVSRANCLTRAGKPQDALMDYYHADYLSPDNVKICRATAWAETLAGEYNKANKSFERLLLTSTLPADYLNAGHSRLIQGDIATAYGLYKKALENSNNDKSAFEQVFKDDIETLKNKGVSPLNIDIILDSLLK